MYIGSESPGLYPSPSVVAGNGLFAILGYDLSLLRLYKVGSESATCIQGYHPKLDPNPSSPERMRQLFCKVKAIRKGCPVGDSDSNLTRDLLVPGSSLSTDLLTLDGPLKKPEIRISTAMIHPCTRRLRPMSKTGG
jgi:hypothetical protein